MRLTPTPSPNFDDRTTPVSMLVLHYTGMETAQLALDRLCDPQAKVSAHYMVDELGRVFQMVDEDKRAWHAGVSTWRGQTDINSASIGIEIVNGGHDFDLPDYPSRQIDAVIKLCQAILFRQSIKAFDIVGHSDIAPQRKQDPGEKFPWSTLASAGIGAWPNTGPFDTKLYAPTSGTPHWMKTITSALSEVGYGVTDDSIADIISAVQRRYRPEMVNGQLDTQTLRIILRLRMMIRTSGSMTSVG